MLKSTDTAMKNAYLSILSLLLLTVSACKKEDTSPASYVLKSETFQHSSDPLGQSYHFSYNADHLVSEMKNIRSYYYSFNNGPVEVRQTTIVTSFEYNNGLPVKATITEGSKSYYYEYTYKGRQLDQAIGYSNGGIEKYYLFKYNSQGKLAEMIDSIPGRVNYRYVYDYQNNNLASLTTYILYSAPLQKSKVEFSNYDDKANFINAINGLPISFDLHSFSYFSRNNLGLKKHYATVDMDKAFGAPAHTMAFTYQYNEAGLPVKMFYGGWTVSYEYQKL